MPKELKEELSYFKCFLEHLLRGTLAQLKAGAYASPPLRPYFERRVKDSEAARRSGIHPLSVKSSSKTSIAPHSPEEQLQ